MMEKKKRKLEQIRVNERKRKVKEGQVIIE